ncbi:hypothetical protein BUALT_Bualt02G0067900 [Buddleja alternifolia]|uniref:Protein kinase domain-containing protein n=1 Tax=Buddleja alternifolia TaxID=168488 RepID=A0AAV6XYJ3_9LAMI|nr:hypothetical protein BUALT_Bualt02G0067900 [Buddleja alternifolia]
MFPISESMQSEVGYVRSIKESFQDPLDKLSTWQFNDIENPYDTYICSFNGVECWNSSEGRIPQQLVTLVRMTTFTVANNLLSGPVPAFAFSMFPRDIYANNGGLCGYPLDPCESGGRDPFISMMEKFASRMSFSELSEATDSFSENNIIAIGETGITYRGTLSNGWSLAIKNLFNIPHLQHEFQFEITMLGTFRHKNLIQVIGFCHEFNGRFIIYKLMPNGNLHDCLFSSNINMEWPLRVKIAVGIANGIAWLHQNRVVHRGISAKCVQLDENYDPKISEFGKATTPNGTLNGEFSVPGSYVEDIYGFGMVLLALVMGKKHEEFISSFESIDYGDMFGLISELQATGDCEDEMCHFLRIAKNCVECDSGSCPSMVEVYQMLIDTTRYDCDTENEIQFAK